MLALFFTLKVGENMIYTITFNPAVDLVIQVPNCQIGTLNRSKGEEYVAGGKGINMSVILKQFGIDNICLLYTSPSPRDTERSRMPSSA